MVDTYQFKLSNNKGKGIYFYSADGVSENLSLSSVSLPMPGLTAKENISLPIGGFNKTISINFKLVADGDDHSAPLGDNIITLQDQWNHIMGDEQSNIVGIVQDNTDVGDELGTTTSNLQYTLQIFYKDYDGTSRVRYYVGLIEDISIEPVEGEPFLRGRLTLKLGSNKLAEE